MESVMAVIRDIIGNPPTYFQVGSVGALQWNYGELMEYMFAGLLCVISVSYIFRILLKIIERRK